MKKPSNNLVIKATLSIILCLFIFSSCTMQKRNYRSGYYVAWKKSNSNIASTHSSKNKKETDKNKSLTRVVSELQNYEPVIIEANAENIISLPKKSEKTKLIFNDDCGDLLTLRSGDEVKVKVLEINDKEIKYKRCDNLDGPLITINKSDVFMIKYANGSKEIFKEEPKKDNTPKNNGNNNGNNNAPPKLNGLALAAILCATVGIFLFGLGPLVGFVLGINALKEINQNPDRYWGKGLAIAAIVIGGIALLFGILILIVLIAIMLGL